MTEKMNERLARVMVSELKQLADRYRDVIADELRRLGKDRMADEVQRLDIGALLEQAGVLPPEDRAAEAEASHLQKAYNELFEAQAALQANHDRTEESLRSVCADKDKLREANGNLQAKIDDIQESNALLRDSNDKLRLERKGKPS
jgi:hypothetical protein